MWFIKSSRIADNINIPALYTWKISLFCGHWTVCTSLWMFNHEKPNEHIYSWHIFLISDSPLPELLFVECILCSLVFCDHCLIPSMSVSITVLHLYVGLQIAVWMNSPVRMWPQSCNQHHLTWESFTWIIPLCHSQEWRQSLAPWQVLAACWRGSGKHSTG